MHLHGLRIHASKARYAGWRSRLWICSSWTNTAFGRIPSGKGAGLTVDDRRCTDSIFGRILQRIWKPRSATARRSGKTSCRFIFAEIRSCRSISTEMAFLTSRVRSEFTSIATSTGFKKIRIKNIFLKLIWCWFIYQIVRVGFENVLKRTFCPVELSKNSCGLQAMHEVDPYRSPSSPIFPEAQRWHFIGQGGCDKRKEMIEREKNDFQ